MRPGEHPLESLTVAYRDPRSPRDGDRDRPVRGGLHRVHGRGRTSLVPRRDPSTRTPGRSGRDRPRCGPTFTVGARSTERSPSCSRRARSWSDRWTVASSVERSSCRRSVRGRGRGGLTDALVADTVGQAGGLPLLSTTLLELWTQRRDRTLRSMSTSAGGVEGAVARLAEDAYGRLEDEQAAAERILVAAGRSGDGRSGRSTGLPDEFDLAEQRCASCRSPR